MRWRKSFIYPADYVEPLSPVESGWWALALWQADADEAWQDYMEGLS